MKNEFQIEEATKNDFSQIKDLLVDLQNYIIEIDKFNLNILSADYREKYFEFMMKDSKENEGKVFVCKNGKNVLGMIAGFVQKYDERDKLDYACPKKGIIAELIVHKESRASGVGSAMLDKMEKYFKSIGCTFVQVDVFAYNENAKKFYSKNGYEDRMVTMFKKL